MLKLGHRITKSKIPHTTAEELIVCVAIKLVSTVELV